MTLEGFEVFMMPQRQSEDLTERNSQIIAKYMENYTLESVGASFGLTRERVRQILKESGIQPRRHTGLPKPFKKSRPTTIERFWGNVDKTGANGQFQHNGELCWIWTGNVDKTGRGRFSGRKIHRNEKYVHRLSFYLATGKSPTLQVLHACGNYLCVNSSHLYQGTQSEAMKKRKMNDVWKENLGKGQQQRSHNLYLQKLQQVLEFLAEHLESYALELVSLGILSKSSSTKDLSKMKSEDYISITRQGKRKIIRATEKGKTYLLEIQNET